MTHSLPGNKITVRFPVKEKQRYYDIHYAYLKNTLAFAGCKIIPGRGMDVDNTRFFIELDGARALIDFGDFPDLHPQLHEFNPVFKFHYSGSQHRDLKNVFPLGPVSFHNWEQFHMLKKEIQYSATGDLIVNAQRAYGDARLRRKRIAAELIRRFGANAVTERVLQEEFWKLISRMLVSVCVPGARVNMLDRGQMQYMALGGCTLSPRLDIVLPGFSELIPGEHYLACADQYEDLFDLIAWCANHRAACAEIGANAAALFAACSAPERILASMLDALGK